MGGYLKDPTGARRVWPFTCHGTVDRDGLEKMRDQLWAEAVHRFKSGAPWWLETPELEALATAEQTARFVVDAWEAPIREWLGDRTDTTIWELLEHALGLPREAWTQGAQNRVAAILTRLSFGRHRPRTPNGRQNRYLREPTSREKSAAIG
jgi:putative DNA primase/helicase